MQGDGVMRTGGWNKGPSLNRFGRAFAALAVVVLALASAMPVHAETPAEAFKAHAPQSTQNVDHAAWTALLGKYVKPQPSGLNRVDYAQFKKTDHQTLKAYIRTLETVNPAELARAEQFAFWANLYNAKTIDIVLDHYPVKSIKDISLGGSLTTLVTGGPWKADVVKVAGRDLSLDDIEHGILRKVFANPSRVHYAVNCASVGCPNLATEAWTGATLDTKLAEAARAYVNSPRGAKVEDGKLVVSSIYKWFREDFGGSNAGVVSHIKSHADEALKAKLRSISSIADHRYDWSLNDVR